MTFSNSGFARIQTNFDSVKIDLNQLKDSMETASLNLRMQNYEVAATQSQENLKTVESLQIYFLPYSERLQEAVKIQTKISEVLRTPSGKILDSGFFLADQQQKNLFHTAILIEQSKRQAQAKGKKKQEVSTEIFQKVLGELIQARVAENSTLNSLQTAAELLSAEKSNTAKIHLENALKFFNQSQNSKSQKNQNSEEKQDSQSKQDQNQKQRAQNERQNSDGKNESQKTQNSQNDESKSQNSQSAQLQKLTADEAQKKLETLNKKRKILKQQRIKETGRKQKSNQRPAVDKNW